MDTNQLFDVMWNNILSDHEIENNSKTVDVIQPGATVKLVSLETEVMLAKLKDHFFPFIITKDLHVLQENSRNGEEKTGGCSSLLLYIYHLQ